MDSTHSIKPLLIWAFLKETLDKGMADGIPRLGASLAFYTMISLVPMLTLLLTVASYLYGGAAAQEQIYTVATHVAGAAEANTIQDILKQALEHPTTGVWQTLLNCIILLFGAAGLFNQLQDAFRLIWRVPPRTGKAVLRIVEEYLVSSVMVLGMVFLLIASVAMGAILTFVIHVATDLFPIALKLTQIVTLLLNGGFLTLFFAFLFKVIPRAKVLWQDVWLGALFTAVLFEIGQFLIAFYLGHINLMAGYGVAGSLAALMIWVYYSAHICFIGAEFTYLYTYHYGSQKKNTHQSHAG